MVFSHFECQKIFCGSINFWQQILGSPASKFENPCSTWTLDVLVKNLSLSIANKTFCNLAYTINLASLAQILPVFPYHTSSLLWMATYLLELVALGFLKKEPKFRRTKFGTGPLKFHCISWHLWTLFGFSVNKISSSTKF